MPLSQTENRECRSTSVNTDREQGNDNIALDIPKWIKQYMDKQTCSGLQIKKE